MFNNPRFGISKSAKQKAQAAMMILSRSEIVKRERIDAEVNFRNREVAGTWGSPNDQLGDPPETKAREYVPDHWDAGAAYAKKLILAYGEAVFAKVDEPAELDQFLEGCTHIIAKKTYRRKLQYYDRRAKADLPRVTGNFRDLVRVAASKGCARLSLKAWEEYRKKLRTRDADASPAEEPPENGQRKPVAPVVSITEQREVAAEDFDSAESREARLQAFIETQHATIAAVRRAAGVSKPDMQRWRHGELPADSVMSRRIEDVLAEKKPPDLAEVAEG